MVSLSLSKGKNQLNHEQSVYHHRSAYPSRSYDDLCRLYLNQRFYRSIFRARNITERKLLLFTRPVALVSQSAEDVHDKCATSLL